MDTRLRNLLHDLATEMPVDVDGSGPRTLRKARGRRILTAGAGVAVAVAFVVASVSVFRFADDPTTPAVSGPNPQPTGFEGLWPETDAEALGVTQAAVDEGHHPLQTSPEGTASLLATNLLRWQPGDDQIERSIVEGDEAVVVISNRVFGDDVPVITIAMRQLGVTGPNGVWSVVGVSDPPLPYPGLIELEEVTQVAPGIVHVTGRVSDLYDGAPALEADVFDGATLEPSLGSARYELADRTFGFDVDVSATPDGRATLLLTMPDAVGQSLGGVLVSVETPVGVEEPQTNVSVEGVPSEVAATARGIYDAAGAGDIDGLREFLDPNTFAYNFDDGSDPIPAWRQDPSVLDLMVAVLELPAADPRVIEGYGTFTIRPYLIDSDFDALTKGERADLGSLGYTEEDIQLMIDGGHGYQGPRLAIDETGLWRNFTTMGE
jgi:hypothetical protein